MRKLLKKLLVIQEMSNVSKEKKLGKGFSKAYRLNPFNPLSYLVIVFSLILGVLMFGFVGIKEEMDLTNPFKWN